MFSTFFKSLFGTAQEEQPYAPSATRTILISDLKESDYHITFSLKTDPGCIRENNEDNALVLTKEPEAFKDFLAVIADGMGGHAAGEVASGIVIDVIPTEYRASRDERTGFALREALVLANSEIFDQAQANPTYRRMGTTCIAVAIREGRIFFAHVGDSRLYRLRQNTLTQLTEDHSYVMSLVKEGQITREEAAHHENKNIILRAMGTKEQVEVDITEEGLPVQINDKYLLCTDGLHDVVTDNEIATLMQIKNPDDATTQMVETAKQYGGPDNITVILMEICPRESNNENTHQENNQS